MCLDKDNGFQPQCLYDVRKSKKVAIDRALQPFPRSKRSGRLSTHAAFQRDDLTPLCCTVPLPQPWGRLSLRGSPLETSPRCGCLTPVQGHHAWQPCTLSPPLPQGLGLLRHLRPPLPHPGIVVSYDVGQAVWECPSATARDESTPSRPPHRRAAWEQRRPPCGFARPAAMPCWRWGVAATLHPARVTTLHTEVPCVPIGCRTRTVPHPWLGNRRPCLPRLRPPRGATP